MSKQTHSDLWVSRDGSWGYSVMHLFNTSKWTSQQQDWLTRHIEENNEPDVDIVSQIDRNEEPDWEED